MQTKKLTFYNFILKITDRQTNNYYSKFYDSDTYREFWSVHTPIGWVHGLYDNEQCKKVLSWFD